MKNKLLGVLIALFLLTITYSGCIEDKETGDKSETGEIFYHNLTIKDLEISTDNLPNISSSTSAHPLAMLIACKILNISTIWTDELYFPYHYGGRIEIVNITHLNTYQYPYYGYNDKERYLIPNASNPDKEYIAENITNKVDRGGTHGSYVGLIEGNYSLIIVARLPSDDELQLAVNNSVDLIAKPIALDAFVFILNNWNQVDNLTVEQIQEIYTGQITNWSEINSSFFSEGFSRITAYQRNDNSGSQELMKTLVMKDLEMIEEEEMVSYSMMGPFDSTFYDVYGIAYSVYYYKQFMATYYNNVKFCGVDGVFPCYDTIYAKTYPYTTEVYIVIRDDLDSSSSSYKIRDWLLGDDGQEIVKESGYVPISE